MVRGMGDDADAGKPFSLSSALCIYSLHLHPRNPNGLTAHPTHTNSNPSKPTVINEQHWPGFFISAFSNDAYLEGLARCVEQGLTRTVGVSNFNQDRMRGAAKVLKSRGTVLSSNQVQYSLLYRKPEKNGGGFGWQRGVRGG